MLEAALQERCNIDQPVCGCLLYGTWLWITALSCGFLLARATWSPIKSLLYSYDFSCLLYLITGVQGNHSLAGKLRPNSCHDPEGWRSEYSHNWLREQGQGRTYPNIWHSKQGLGVSVDSGVRAPDGWQLEEDTLKKFWDRKQMDLTEITELGKL